MPQTKDLTRNTTPTAVRPLLGMTVLMVEDSLYTCDAIRLMCLHSGARIRRADCLRSARRHLKVYRPSVVIVDLGLPDGSGLDLIAELNAATPRVLSLIGISGDDQAQNASLAAGADRFLAKPVTNLGHFQQTVLQTLPNERQPNGPRLIRRNGQIRPDPMTYRDDMLHAANLLQANKDGPVLDYVAHFLDGVARLANDRQLAQAAQTLAQRLANGAVSRRAIAHIAQMVQDRMEGPAVI